MDSPRILYRRPKLRSASVLRFALTFRLTLLFRTRVALRVLIEFVFAFLAAKRVVLAFIHAGGRSFFFVYLHAANWIFHNNDSSVL